MEIGFGAAWRKLMRCKLHFLIVEDDDVVTMLILEQLTQVFGGYSHLECTSSPSIACESLTHGEFDAILFDLSLVNQGGNTIVTTIRSRAPYTPLFLLVEKCHQLQGIGSLLEGTSGCLFKHELRERTWLKRLCAAVAHRNAVPIPLA